MAVGVGFVTTDDREGAASEWKERKLSRQMFGTIRVFSMRAIAIFEGHAGQKIKISEKKKSTRFKLKNSTEIFSLKLNSKSRLSMIYVYEYTNICPFCI